MGSAEERLSPKVVHELCRRWGAQRAWVIDSKQLDAVLETLRLSATGEHPIREVELLGGPELRVPDLRQLGKAAREAGKRYKKPGCDPASFNELLIAHISRASCAGSAACSLGAHVVVERLEITCEESPSCHLVGVGVSRDAWRTAPLVEELLDECERPSYDGYRCVSEGLRTIDQRLRQHNDAAMAMASYLACHPKVARVSYPGFPSHPDHSIASQQLTGGFGPWVCFELAPNEALTCDLDLCQLADGTWRLYCNEEPLALCSLLESALASIP